MLLPPDESTLYWESTYGDLPPQGQAGVFFGDAEAKTIIKIIPSGVGDQDLIALVKGIVPIQSVVDRRERASRWLSYLRSASSDEGRKVALRSFIADGGEWSQLAPILEHALTNSQLSSEFRAFGFGIVAFNVVREKWGDSRDDVLAFLCRLFSNERDPRLAMQYVYSLGLIFSYCDDEDFREQRRSVRRKLESCLDQRRSLATSSGPAVDRNLGLQYQTLRARYLTH